MKHVKLFATNFIVTLQLKKKKHFKLRLFSLTHSKIKIQSKTHFARPIFVTLYPIKNCCTQSKTFENILCEAYVRDVIPKFVL